MGATVKDMTDDTVNDPMAEAVAWLYVPGSRPELFDKAAARADGLVVDLEDAVHPAARPAARSALAGLARLSTPVPVVVRVNEVGSADFAADIEAVAPLVGTGAVTGIRVPKVESPEQVERVAAATAGWGGGRHLVCQLESARGVTAAHEIARVPGVHSIMLGEADLRGDLRLPRGRRGEAGLSLARQSVVLAARAAGLCSPQGSAFTDLTDEAGLRESCVQLRDLGFAGRSCVHPRQVGVVRAAFRPTAQDIDWARGIVSAAARAGTVAATTADDGSFVDPAVVRQAELVLAADARADAS